MCSKEEVLKIVQESEDRITNIVHVEINKLRKEVKEDRDFSHGTISTTISNLGNEFITAVQELKSWRAGIDSNINELNTWKATHTVETNGLNEKVNTILGGVKWLLTLVIGTLVVAGLRLIII